MKEQSLGSNIQWIYKMHNGIVISEIISALTKERFTFVAEPEEGYKFTNGDEVVFLDRHGNKVQCDVSLDLNYLETAARNRISATREMVEGLSL